MRRIPLLVRVSPLPLSFSNYNSTFLIFFFQNGGPLLLCNAGPLSKSSEGGVPAPSFPPPLRPSSFPHPHICRVTACATAAASLEGEEERKGEGKSGGIIFFGANGEPPRSSLPSTPCFFWPGTASLLPPGHRPVPWPTASLFHPELFWRLFLSSPLCLAPLLYSSSLFTLS